MIMSLLLAACATGGGPPAAYESVYRSGCAAANADAEGAGGGIEYDPERFGRERAYRRYWALGYADCFTHQHARWMFMLDVPMPTIDGH